MDFLLDFDFRLWYNVFMMTDKEIARALGKMVHETKPLTCPVCAQFFTKDLQEMASDGDEREFLFCPHCDLSVKLVVLYNPGW